MMKAWSNESSTPETLHLALAYDIASGEGFGLFGIDAYCDVIATQAGALFAKRIKDGTITIPYSAELRPKLDECFKDARSQFISHSIFANRKKVLGSFLSVMFYHDGTKFVLPEGKYLFGSIRCKPWQSTLGIILENNKRKLSDPMTCDALINETIRVLNTKNMSVAPGGDENLYLPSSIVDSSKVKLKYKDLRALYEMIEILSFIGEGR